MITGGIAGGLLLSGSVYAYFSSYPSEAEHLFVARALRAFSQAVDFDAKKLIYFSIPEYSIPDVMPLALQKDGNSDDVTQQQLLLLWATTVFEIHSKLANSWLVSAREEMRSELISSALCRDNLRDRLSTLIQILQPSLERNMIIAKLIDDELLKEKWVNRTELTIAGSAFVNGAPPACGMWRLTDANVQSVFGVANQPPTTVQ